MGVLTLFGWKVEVLPTVTIIVTVLAIAVFGSLATDAKSAWYELLRKPDWQPPASLFAPVWSSIYIMFIISAIVAWHTTSGSLRVSVMILYALNGALNLAWSLLFFRSRNPLVAGVDIVGLLVSILWIIVRMAPHSKVASGLLIPYLLWVAFATVLNWTIVRMN
jgi:tryptophan-rich sensory protein